MKEVHFCKEYEYITNVFQKNLNKSWKVTMAVDL